MKNGNTLNRSEGILRIKKSVSKLIKPPLEPLYQVFVDEKAAVQAERSELLRKIEELRQEGFEAAIQLMTLHPEPPHITNGSYFDRIENKEDENNEKH